MYSSHYSHQLILSTFSTTGPPHGAASERSASIFSLILLLGLLIIMIVNLL